MADVVCSRCGSPAVVAGPRQASWERISVKEEELRGTWTTTCEQGHTVTGEIPLLHRMRRRRKRPQTRGF